MTWEGHFPLAKASHMTKLNLGGAGGSLLHAEVESGEGVSICWTRLRWTGRHIHTLSSPYVHVQDVHCHTCSAEPEHTACHPGSHTAYIPVSRHGKIVFWGVHMVISSRCMYIIYLSNLLKINEIEKA